MPRLLALLPGLLALAPGCADDRREPPPRVAPVAPPRPPPPPAPRAARSTAPVDTWTAFASQPWGFRAEFPAAPQTEIMTVPTPAGELEMHMFTVDREPWAYMLTVFDGPPGGQPRSAATILDDARDGAVRNVRGRLVREQQDTHGGLPARRLEIRAGEADDVRRVEVLLVLRERRLYQLLVVAPIDAAIEPQADRFFAALHMT